MSAPRRPSVTTHDVARLAGVSQPTVSLVLSGNPKARVALATRERVHEAARQLGYRANLVARSLVQRKSFAIGVVIPDLRNPFFADVVGGAERVASEAGYAVLLCEAGEQGAQRHLEALVGRQIDGVIMDATGAASMAPGLLDGIPVVLIDEPSDEMPGVASDALAAGRIAAEHLLALGHRRFGFAGPATLAWAFHMRERGFVQALRKAGIRLVSDDVRRAAPTAAGGFSAMKELLTLHYGPTAVFFANDLMALGALKACAAQGVHVPRDLSIVGCDDIETARLVTPELTTVNVRARELGARAARVLLKLLHGESARAAALIPVTLAVRGTTTAPRGTA